MLRTLRRPFIALAALILLVTLAAPTVQAGGPGPFRDGWSALWNWLFAQVVRGGAGDPDGQVARPPESAPLGYSLAVDPNGSTLAAEPEPPVPQAAPDVPGDR